MLWYLKVTYNLALEGHHKGLFVSSRLDYCN